MVVHEKGEAERRSAALRTKWLQQPWGVEGRVDDSHRGRRWCYRLQHSLIFPVVGTPLEAQRVRPQREPQAFWRRKTTR